MSDVLSLIIAKYNYWLYVILMMIGLYGMIAKNNLIKKVVGMNIFQTAIILFYVSIGYKTHAGIPIITSADTAHGVAVKAADYINPLTSCLMLTAIVVSVATFGYAMALAVRIYQRYKTLEEDELRMRLSEE